MKVEISQPTLIGPCGYQKVNAIYHFLSYRSGGHKLEEDYLQMINGFIKGTPWFSSGNIYDETEWKLCYPNQKFAFYFHTLDNFGELICVHHYYKAMSIDGILIELEWLGQHTGYRSSKKYSLYKIGDKLEGERVKNVNLKTPWLKKVSKRISNLFI